MVVIPIDRSRRSRATQIDILNAYAERLREIRGLSEQNVVVSDQATPKQAPTGGRIHVTVAFNDGTFDVGEAASHAIATENANLFVSFYQCLRLDKTGRSEAKLLGGDALLIYKQRILSKLLVDDPSKGTSSNTWEPMRIETNGSSRVRVPLLRDMPILKRSHGPFDAWKEWVGIRLAWEINFDWDLYDVN